MTDSTELLRMEQCFKALGSMQRIRIVQTLATNPDGCTIGTLQATLGIPWSTLSHHLTVLARAGLVAQDRHGREVHCTLQPQTIWRLVETLTALPE